MNLTPYKIDNHTLKRIQVFLNTVFLLYNLNVIYPNGKKNCKS